MAERRVLELQRLSIWQRIRGVVIEQLGRLMLLLIVTPSIWAQINTADLVGTVTDASGASLPAATVTIRNSGTNEVHSVKTGAAGEYTFSLLQIGSYSLTVEATGFKKFSAPGLVLSSGDRARVDAKMAVGDVSQTVEVSSTPPTLQTDSSSVSSTVDSAQVQDLPLSGRNYIQLVQNQAGVNPGPATSMSGGTRPDDRRQSSSFSANGQPETQNAQFLDGLDNVDRQQGGLGVRPSIDGIAEIQVQTNLFTADVSRTAGAVVNVITKSGTNQFHGTVYEFWQNDIFDARDYFARVGQVAKPELRQHQFGGSVGGPIIKDKTFFFADIENLRIVQGENPVTQTVPTLYEEQHPGDFTDLGGPFAKLTGPLDPIGLAYFKMFPAPTNSAASNNFVYAGTKTQKGLTGDVRVDEHFSPNNSFFARYSGNPVTTFTPGILPPTTVDGVKVNPGGASAINTSVEFPGGAQEDAQGLQLNYVHIFKPNLVMELKAGYTYIKIWSLPLNYGTNVSEKLGIPNINTDTFSSGLTIMSPSGYNQPGNTIFDGLGDAAFIPILNTNHVYQYQGAITYSTGNHNFKFGGAIIRRHLNDLQQLFAQGIYAYFGGPVSTVEAGQAPENSLAQMLTGAPNLLLRANSLFKPHYQFWEPSIYAQDDWRATPHLTINFGLRYEVYPSFTEERNRFSNFNLPTLSVVLASNNNRHAGIGTDYGDVSPRIGFAATVANGTVIRGGYGISYTPGIQPGFNNIPFSSSFSCVPGAPATNGGCPAPYGTPDAGFPVPAGGNAADLSGTVTGRPHNTKVQYVEMWNLIAQQQIHANTFSVGYVGSRGHHFSLDPNIDLPLPATGAQLPLVYSTELPAVTNVTERNYSGVTAYDGLLLIFQRQYRTGFTFNANYTWSHGLSNFQGPGIPNNANRNLIPTDPQYDYGNSDLDIRHRFVVEANYELPFGKTATGIRGLLESGWQVNGISSFNTGEAFTVGDSSSIGGNRINIPTNTADRPNLVGNAKVSHPNVNEWFNPSAFQLQTFGTPGNEAVNQLFGPRFVRTDFSVFKTLKLTERFNLELRSEIFNIFNHPFFNQPGDAITGYTGTTTGSTATPTGGVGTIGSTSPNSLPREVQFAGKVRF